MKNLKWMIAPGYLDSGSDKYYIMGDEGVIKLDISEESKPSLGKELKERKKLITAFLEIGKRVLEIM